MLDLEELLATRLLVQGNSGSGKSHLLRRLLEQSANLVQQAIIDPEGDFV
ncbi:MAG: ATP-binding protein, partial [Microvirga sp.]|nr:ATP-binding protein [Microvirga sp.]